MNKAFLQVLAVIWLSILYFVVIQVFSVELSATPFGLIKQADMLSMFGIEAEEKPEADLAFKKIQSNASEQIATVASDSVSKVASTDSVYAKIFADSTEPVVIDSAHIDYYEQAAFKEPWLTQPQLNVQIPTDSAKQRILIAGDSMAECLWYGLKKYDKNHDIKLVSWYGSSTIKWAHSDTLRRTIARYKPTKILICLGANELFIGNIKSRNKYLKRLIAQIDTVPYYFVGPPNWKEDTGFNEMVMGLVPPGQFFLSKYLPLARRKDGAHPTIKASKLWADTVSKWLTSQSRFPIWLNRPYEKVVAKVKPGISQKVKLKQA